MSMNSKDIDKEFEKRGLKRIDPSELPEAIKRLKGKGQKTALRDCKSEVKISLDADIVRHFREKSGKNGEDYKILINAALRKLVDSEKLNGGKFDEILKDREFLSRLKSELETV